MADLDPRWNDVVHFQQQLTTACAAYFEVRIEASIDAVIEAIAANRSATVGDIQRAADTVSRGERKRKRLLRLYVYPQAVEAERVARGQEDVYTMRDSVTRALGLLGNVDSAIVIAVGEGETPAEVAAVTGLSVSAVRQRLCRARARVRELLAA
jgi:hypothetical protein